MGNQLICLSEMGTLLEMPLAYHIKILGFSLFFLNKEKNIPHTSITVKHLSLPLGSPFLCGSGNVSFPDSRSWQSGKGNPFSRATRYRLTNLDDTQAIAKSTIHTPIIVKRTFYLFPFHLDFLRNLSNIYGIPPALAGFTKLCDTTRGI